MLAWIDLHTKFDKSLFGFAKYKQFHQANECILTYVQNRKPFLYDLEIAINAYVCSDARQLGTLLYP